MKVEGVSMMPSLDDQERIFINKFVYHIEAISPGDVVVFRYPRDLSKASSSASLGLPATAFVSTPARSTSMTNRW